MDEEREIERDFEEQNKRRRGDKMSECNMHMAYHNTAGPTLFSLAERSCDLVCQTDE